MTATKPCPSCPDGYEWNALGPTARACRTCGGRAVVRLNGESLVPSASREPREYSCEEHRERLQWD